VFAKALRLVVAVILLGLGLAVGARDARAAGICGGSVTVSPDVDPGWDFLALLWQASGVAVCTDPRYQFYFWNGFAAEAFTSYSASPSAYWDTHNLIGESDVIVLVKDASSPYAYDTYSPWFPIQLNSHGYAGSFDDRVQGISLQNVDPQGTPVDSGGYLPTGLLTYINFQPSSNAIARYGSPQCASGGSVFGWQGAYAYGVPGDGPFSSAFVQPGVDYACTGDGGSVFAVSVTSEQIDCPLGGADKFGATDDQLLYDQNGVAVGVSSSPTPEYKGCFVAASAVGISPGNTPPFEIASSGTTVAMWANPYIIFQAAQSGSGFYYPWIDTELAYMNNAACEGCPEAPGIGDNLNNGMLADTLIPSSWYYDESALTWKQLPNNAPGLFDHWQSQVYEGNNFVMGDGVYCDRPFGFYGGWSGYSSSYVFAKDLHGAC